MFFQKKVVYKKYKVNKPSTFELHEDKKFKSILNCFLRLPILYTKHCSPTNIVKCCCCSLSGVYPLSSTLPIYSNHIVAHFPVFSFFIVCALLAFCCYVVFIAVADV